MTYGTAEPIEAATVLLASLALMVSLTLCGRAWRTYRAAVAAGKCDAVLALGLGRVINEAIRVGVALGVGYAGWVNANSPVPAVVTQNRAIFQTIWLLLAFGCFFQSVFNEINARRVVAIIERERAAGRMGTTEAYAEGRRDERAEQETRE